MNPPIALFAYARPDHLRRTVASLLKNPEVGEHEIFIFSDGPKKPEMAESVKMVRELIRTIKGFRAVSVVEQNINLGLAKSIIQGVSQVLSRHDHVIVLEDDMEVSPFFLCYMTDALRRYRDDDRVASVHGYVFPVAGALPEAFFLRGADCWGWATWRRAWEMFNPDGQDLLSRLRENGLLAEFDFMGTCPNSEMLEDQIRGANDSWAIRWHASAFLADKLTLYPGRSLVRNIGVDNSGTHCGETTQMNVNLSQQPICLEGLEVKASPVAYLEFQRYFKQLHGGRMAQFGRAAVRLLRRIAG